MKKLLAMLLAIMMVMTVAFAFAEGEGEGGETEVKDSGYDSPVEESLGKPTKAFNITITKGYVINGSDEASEEYPKHPADVLKFEVSTTKAPEYYFHGKKDATVTPPAITITNQCLKMLKSLKSGSQSPHSQRLASTSTIWLKLTAKLPA